MDESSVPLETFTSEIVTEESEDEDNDDPGVK